MDESTTPTSDPRAADFDVAVIGAGFAGLAAAQVLGHAQRSVLLLGAGPTRNAEAAHAHNVLTRDGTPPGELLALGMAEVESLATVTSRSELVEAVEVDQDGSFGLVDPAGNRFTSRCVLLATGARDRLPDVAGLAALWGRRAHSCPFCDGAAYAGGRLLVLAEEPVATHLRTLLSSWTSRLIVASPAVVERLVEEAGDIVATLHDDPAVTVDGVFVHTEPVPRVDLVADLELARRGPYVATDAVGRTSLDGLWAAGDCAWRDGEPNPGGQVVAAMAAGARAGAMIVGRLQGITIPDTPPAEQPRTAERLTTTSAGRPGHVPEGLGLEEFWEGHYGAAERVWTGEPNVGLMRAVEDLVPSTALDLGCGEGADAVWLAEHGWQVTGVDVSATAIERARAAAAERGVEDRVTFRVADLGTDPPTGEHGLVVAAYLLSPVEIPRDQILQAAGRAVGPGGTLVVLSHLGFPDGGHQHLSLPSVAEQLEALALDGDWEAARAEELTRTRRSHDGTVVRHTDSVITAVRLR